MKISTAWKKEPILNAFRIPMRIINPKTQVSVIKYCLFDTGFSGYLGLMKDVILQLGLNKIGTGKGIGVNGVISYNTFDGIIEFVSEEKATLFTLKGNQQKNGTKYIPVQEFGINIIGMKAIMQKSWIILHDRNVLCMIDL